MNAKANELSRKLKNLPNQNRATASLKAGLRNITQDCCELGHGSGGSIAAAENYLKKLTTK